MKPFLSSGNHLEEILVLLILYEFRPAQPLTHPFLTVDRIGIDGIVEFVFLLPCEAMHYGEELPYVVGAAFKHWAFEHLCACVDEHSTVFHLAGIARTRRIDGDGDGVGFWRTFRQ